MPARALVLVLRFRDLNPGIPGYTIAEHNKITEGQGSTWWGWWNKQSESVPLAMWGEVAKQATAAGTQGLRVFLLDSGQRKLYAAPLFQVHVQPDSEPCASPEDGKTPRYYNPADNPTKRATWFRIGLIVEEPSDEALRTLMYAEAPHDDLMLATRTDFANRKMGGINDLLAFGNVTYWVGTPAGADAKPPLNRIDAKVLDPIAPRDVVRADSPRILHITDLHVGSHHAFPSGGDAHRPSLANALYAALKSHGLPGIVVVSGDLTWSGTKDEFRLAYDCLDAIRSSLGLNKQHFVIVPGNHDIQWTRQQALAGDYRFGEKAEIASAEARANYEEFFARWYGVAPNSFLSLGRRFFLVGGPTLDVLGLNSVVLQQIEGHFAGVGRVTEAAFDASASELGWSEPVRATTVRLLVLHHHLVPVIVNEAAGDASKGFGVALDAGNQIVRALRSRVNLVLHGHQHQPFAGHVNREELHGTRIKNDSGLLIVGGGSAGVVDDALGPIQQRTFNLLHLDDMGVRLELFATAKARDQFEPESRSLRADWKDTWRVVE